jgi:hypothetical protein
LDDLDGYSKSATCVGYCSNVFCNAVIANFGPCLRTLSAYGVVDSTPSAETREVNGSVLGRDFTFRIPANYRAEGSRAGIAIMNPDEYQHLQCARRNHEGIEVSQVMVELNDVTVNAANWQPLQYNRGGVVSRIRYGNEPDGRDWAELEVNGDCDAMIDYFENMSLSGGGSVHVSSPRSERELSAFGEIVNSIHLK